jgi:hypothetical protein
MQQVEPLIQKKNRCIYTGYEWANGSWSYARQPDLPMEIPLPDRSSATISQAEVSTAEKALGVWSTVDGNDSEHISKNVTGRLKKMGIKDDKRTSTCPFGLDSVQTQTVAGDTLRFGYLSNAINYCTSNPTERKFPHLTSPGH